MNLSHAVAQLVDPQPSVPASTQIDPATVPPPPQAQTTQSFPQAPTVPPQTPNTTAPQRPRLQQQNVAEPESASDQAANQTDTDPVDSGTINLPETSPFADDLLSLSGSDFAVPQSSLSSSPRIIGDFFGGFSAFSGTQTIVRSFTLPGEILSGGPGLGNSTIGFEVGVDSPADDLFTTGIGVDISGDGNPDFFALAEPLPTSDAPASPGPGFIFDAANSSASYVALSGGTAPIDGIYTDGENWFVTYQYTSAVGLPNLAGNTIPVPGPGVATRRIKIAENFSPEVVDRYFMNYSFFNDAYGGLGDISRYILGMERIVVDDLVSIEVRLPVAGTYGSRQILASPNDRDFEVGNAVVIGKGVLYRDNSLLWSAGLGVGIPSARHTRLNNGNQDILVVENKTVHLMPFLAAMKTTKRQLSLQAHLQLDIAANGDPVFGNLAGGPLPLLGKFNDSTLMHLDVAATKSIHKSSRRSFVKEVMVNAELHYTSTLQPSDFVSSANLTYANLKSNFNILNATAGLHIIVSDSLMITPAVSVPLRTGLDKQFDYEAIVQVNHLR